MKVATPISNPAVTDGLPPRQRAEAMAAICLALAMATLDTAIANIALPTISTSIGTDPASVIWVVNAYQLAMLAAILPLASLGEVLGHRRVYIGGVLLFTVASLACGLAWSLPSLCVARALQGLGGAAVMSVNTALIRFIYPSKMLGRGVGLNALIVGLSFTAGPSVAALILSVASWHWLFLINVPLGLLALFFSLRTLPHTERAGHGFDRIAAFLCGGFFLLLMLALGTLAQQGSTIVAASEGSIALACGLLLLRRQAGHPGPMLAVDLFRIPFFTLSAITAVCAFITQGLAFVSLPFLLQTILGHSQAATGLLMTPWPAVVAVMALIAGHMSDRYPPAILGGIGLFALSLGMGSLALLPADPHSADIVWRMVLCGAGFGFFQAPNLKALMSSAPAGRSGGASGIVATARLMGQTLGAGLVALCFHLAQGGGPQLALWMGCGFAFAGCIASWLRMASSARH